MKKTLYSLCSEFSDCCATAACRLRSEICNSIRLHEIVTLPDYGGTAVLRLDLSSTAVDSLAQLDRLEVRARSCVTPDYWVTFMGSCSAPFGFDTDVVERVSNSLHDALPDRVSELSISHHSREIANDAGRVRTELKLSESDRVWEIEIPVCEEGQFPTIRVVQSVSAPRPPLDEVSVDGIRCHVDVLPPSPSYQGMLKAYLRSCELELGLASYLMHVLEHGVAWLLAIYVSPNDSRQGVGTAILRELERVALAKRLPYLELAASLTAVPFYKAHGYQDLGRDVHVLKSGDRMDCVRMKKKLT